MLYPYSLSLFKLLLTLYLILYKKLSMPGYILALLNIELKYINSAVKRSLSMNNFLKESSIKF